MPGITLSSKNQITVPVDIVRRLGLKPGDVLLADLVDDHVVLLPQPKSWSEYLRGSAKGVYGSTKEEIDRYIAEVRHGWDIDALKDALAADDKLRAVYHAIPTSSEEGIRVPEIAQKSGVALGDVYKYTKRLEELNAIKRISPELDPANLKANPYYRRIP